MIKLFGKVLSHYHDIASSISLLPSDDFDNKFSHSVEAINNKAMQKTADQMKFALKTYMVENPNLRKQIYLSSCYMKDDQLKMEMEEYLESRPNNKRHNKFAY